uniref:DEK-C domain-containing protein n=1 Tax=Plectus sambesii TaxID=2011161 RepID=A0A914VU88_9BILA
MITDAVTTDEKKSEQEMPPSLTEAKENGGKEEVEKSNDDIVTSVENTSAGLSVSVTVSVPVKQTPAAESPEEMEEDAEKEEEVTAPVVEKKKASPKKAPPAKRDTPKREPPAKKDSDSAATKSPAPKREKKADKAEKATEDADDEEKKPAALFDSPLVVQGKRQRHGVDRLTATATPYQAKSAKADIPSGSGTKLADIEYISALISRTKPDELKHLHRLLFGRPGTSHEVRKNIRAFNGFSFGSGSAEYEKKKGAMEKMTKSDLVSVATLLGTEKSKEKSEVATKILEFLLKPADTGRSAPGKKTKSRKSGTKRKQTPKAKKEKKEKKAKKGSSSEEVKTAGSSDSEESSGDEEEEEKEDGDEEEEEKPEEEEEVEEPPAKKSKAAKASPKKAPPPSPKKAPASPKKAPASSPKKQSGPTDAELTAAVKELLKDANLEEVTMKEMCKMVYDKYPDLDLTERKDFIKTTVKSIIAASNE